MKKIMFICSGNTCRSPLAEGLFKIYLKENNITDIDVGSAGVDKYMETVAKDAKEKGYVSTLWGRRRYLPELNSSNGMLRAFGERVARNMPIQGTAADIIKIAMVRVYNRLKDEKMDAKLILQVHDELIVEAPENEIEKAAKILSEEMENACQMKVRLRADVNTGKTWYQAKG